METKQKERIRRLIEILKKTDRIHLKDAARMLEVSVMTIRRDLHQEDEPLPLTLLGGYIVMVWICPYISRHLLSLNPLLACCRRYSRGER